MSLEFDGTNYHGWQIQPDAISVQEVLEKALSTLTAHPVSIVGAGRTDAGVHATEMVAHFDYPESLDFSHLQYRLNAYLPYDIAVKAILPVYEEAHARFDAISRSYYYRIHSRKNAFLKNRSYFIHQSLDIEKMNEACSILLQYSDFECFSKTHTDVKTFLCDIKSAQWLQTNDVLEFHITADRFLRNMVRAIVGTMINIGLGKMSPQDLHKIIRSKSRSKAGYSVPAHGLYLSKIVYPETVFIT